MLKKQKTRKGPSISATHFRVGTKKKGNDGNIWIIITTSSGTRRWKKMNKVEKKSNNNTTKKSTSISLETLKQLKKKYNVATNGSKKEMAEGLWRVRGRAMDPKDLSLIKDLLPNKEKKNIEKVLNTHINNPIHNFKGLWKPMPKPLRKMSREELIHNLRSFRDAWEKITKRNQDLDNTRLANETTEELRNLLKYYYSNSAKNLAFAWLSK